MNKILKMCSDLQINDVLDSHFEAAKRLYGFEENNYYHDSKLITFYSTTINLRADGLTLIEHLGDLVCGLYIDIFDSTLRKVKIQLSIRENKNSDDEIYTEDIDVTENKLIKFKIGVLPLLKTIFSQTFHLLSDKNFSIKLIYGMIEDDTRKQLELNPAYQLTPTNKLILYHNMFVNKVSWNSIQDKSNSLSLLTPIPDQHYIIKNTQKLMNQIYDELMEITWNYDRLRYVLSIHEQYLLELKLIVR